MRRTDKKREPLNWHSFIRRLALCVLFIAGLAAGGLVFLAGTTSGARWIIEFIDRQPDMDMNVANITGSLLSGLALENVTFRIPDTIEIKITSASLQWGPASLLYGTVSIAPLDVRGISLTITTNPEDNEPSKPLSNFPLPFRLSVKDTRIHDGVMTIADVPIVIDDFELESFSMYKAITIKNLGAKVLDACQLKIPSGELHTKAPFETNARIQWSLDNNGDTAVAGDAILGGNLEVLAIKHKLDVPVAVNSHASLRTGVSSLLAPHFEIDNEVENLEWPDGGNPSIRAPVINARASGWFDDYSLSIEGTLTDETLPPLALQLNGQGNLDGIKMNELIIDTLDGRLSGVGEFSWLSTLGWNLQLQAQDINPGAHWKDWPGTLALNGNFKGSYDVNNDQLAFDADIHSLNGRLRDYPIRARSNIHYHAGEWSSKETTLNLGANRIAASGKINQALHIDWNIAAPELHAVWPGLAGQLRGTGRLRGSLHNILIDGQLDGESLEYDGYRITNLAIRGTPGATSQARYHAVDINARNLDIQGFVIESLQADLQGDPHNHRLNAALITKHGDLELALNGDWRDEINQWQAAITRADIKNTVVGDWIMKETANITLSPNSQTITPSCWQQQNAKICLHGSGNIDALDAGITLHTLPLSLADLWLPPNAGLTGELNGELTLSGSVDTPDIVLVLQPNPGYLSLKRADGDPEIYTWENTGLRGNCASNTCAIKAGLQLTGIGMANADLTLDTQKQLGGNIILHFDELGWLEAWTSQLRNIQGRLNANLKLGGTLEHPLLLGNAHLNDAAAEVPALGINIKNINADLNQTSSKTLSIKARAESGPGHLDFNARIVQPSRTTPMQLELLLTGQQFQIVNLPEANILADPKLTISASSKLIDVKGDVTLPRAEIVLKSLPASAVRVSDDTIIVNEDGRERARTTAIPVRTKVRILLGKQVRFQGFGFESRLSGGIEIVEDPGQPTLAYGELNIDEGRYRAYGQNLTIEYGKLIFQGPYANPGLDIRAVRKSEDITVGLLIGGTLRRISSTVFSDPAMSDSEAIAILITGKSLNAASRTDASMLIDAIATLGLKKGEAVTNQISQTFGLDVLTIDTESELNQSSLLIGKYLTPRIYIYYAIGLFDQASKLALDYQLSRRVKLEAKSGKNQSMDLIYRIER